MQVTLVWFQEKEIIFIFRGETSATVEPPVLQVSDQADRPSTQPEAVSVLAVGVKAGTVLANEKPAYSLVEIKQRYNISGKVHQN